MILLSLLSKPGTTDMIHGVPWHFIRVLDLHFIVYCYVYVYVCVFERMPYVWRNFRAHVLVFI